MAFLMTGRFMLDNVFDRIRMDIAGVTMLCSASTGNSILIAISSTNYVSFDRAKSKLIASYQMTHNLYLKEKLEYQFLAQISTKIFL